MVGGGPLAARSYVEPTEEPDRTGAGMEDDDFGVPTKKKKKLKERAPPGVDLLRKLHQDEKIRKLKKQNARLLQMAEGRRPAAVAELDLDIIQRSMSNLMRLV
jgi:hypothetical protein